jgi:hypothetical protein
MANNSGTLLDRETGANITSTKLARLPEIRLNSAAKLVLQRRNRVLSPKPTNHRYYGGVREGHVDFESCSLISLW